MTGRYIYDKFRAADYGDDDTPFFTTTELSALINVNSQEWRDYLVESKTSCHNYLTFLITEDMLKRDFHTTLHGPGGNDTADLVAQHLIHPHDCSGFNSPSFSLREVLELFKSWKEDSPNNKIPAPKGLDQFYDYMATQDVGFNVVKSHYLKLGNPHYAPVIQAWDICPVPQPMQQELPVKPSKDVEAQPVKPPKVITPVRPNVTVKPQKPPTGVDLVVPRTPKPDKKKVLKKKEKEKR